MRQPFKPRHNQHLHSSLIRPSDNVPETSQQKARARTRVRADSHRRRSSQTVLLDTSSPAPKHSSPTSKASRTGAANQPGSSPSRQPLAITRWFWSHKMTFPGRSGGPAFQQQAKVDRCFSSLHPAFCPACASTVYCLFPASIYTRN